jgi:hypothetical protein
MGRANMREPRLWLVGDLRPIPNHLENICSYLTAIRFAQASDGARKYARVTFGAFVEISQGQN